MKTLTSMSRFRFEELRQGILDGSLAAKWKELDDLPRESLTKAQRVELRQIAAILGIYEVDPQALTRFVKDETWQQLRVVERGNDMFAEIVR